MLEVELAAITEEIIVAVSPVIANVVVERTEKRSNIPA
tara:strand:- start:542 stop:655 length:114 start_codon:yes stop_codon:yes gene_type:complete